MPVVSSAKNAPTHSDADACMSWKSAFEIGQAMDDEPNFIVTFTSVSQAADAQARGTGDQKISFRLLRIKGLTISIVAGVVSRER